MNTHTRLRDRFFARSRQKRLSRPAFSHPKFRSAGQPPIEPLEARIAPATFTVTNTAANGAGSFHQAMLSAQAAGDDVITFSAGLAGQTITLTADLPAQLAGSGSLRITGLTDANGSPNINIRGPGVTGIDYRATSAAHTLVVEDVVLREFFDPGASLGPLTFIGTNLQIDNVHFFSNGGTNSTGGAIFAANGSGTVPVNATITNSIFAGNGGAGAFAGAVYLQAALGGTANYNIANSLFYENTATSGGIGGAIVVDGATATFVNSTITANTAGAGDGGGIYAFASPSVTLRNTILTGNTGGDYVDGDGGGRMPAQSTSILGGAVTFADAANDNYRLAASSTNAIDKGTDSFATAAGLTTDLAGRQRIYDEPTVTNGGAGTVDIGAYEFNAPAPSSATVINFRDAGTAAQFHGDQAGGTAGSAASRSLFPRWPSGRRGRACRIPRLSAWASTAAASRPIPTPPSSIRTEKAGRSR